MTSNERKDELIAILAKFETFDTAQIETSQLRYYSWLRRLIWTQMYRDGFTYMDIGYAWQMNHASVRYGIKSWNDILALKEKNYMGWAEQVKVWENFVADVAEKDGRRDVPVYIHRPSMTLGEFRELTEVLPPETILFLPGRKLSSSKITVF